MKKLLIIFTLVLMIAGAADMVKAQNLPPITPEDGKSNIGTLPPFGGVIDKTHQAGQAVYGDDQLASQNTFLGGMIKIINALLTLIGIIFFGLMLYAGYLWIMARGNDEDVKKAQEIFTQAITGLIVILLARLVSEFIITQFGQAGTSK